MKPQNQQPMIRYHIDRMKLSQEGLSTPMIDRLYKSLFVYSIGFFEMLNSLLVNTKNPFENMTNIWKVYAILLEYSCKADYKLVINQIENKYK